MPMPTEERVSQLVAGLVADRGFDLEGVAITSAGTQARLQVVVDTDGPADLDAIAVLSNDLSETLDATADFGDTPYLLEVTTPGIDRPLTEDRHWRRAQGRKVKVVLREGAEAVEGKRSFEARVGALAGERVALVLGGRNSPHRITVPLADIGKAVVQVEFSTPGAAELELAGGIVPGRPAPGEEPADITGKDSE